MPRSILLLLAVVLLVVGGAIALSINAREVPTKPIEVDVSRDTTAN